MNKVQAMGEKGYPLQGVLTPAPSKKFSDSPERTLTAQLGPNQRLILHLQVFHMTT